MDKEHESDQVAITFPTGSYMHDNFVPWRAPGYRETRGPAGRTCFISPVDPTSTGLY